MSSFTSELVVTPVDERRWKLVRSFTYHVGSQHSRNILTVPKGFVTDFASIPWVFWQFLPAWGRYGKAAVLHDYIYQTHIRTRLEADHLFHEAMLVGGTKAWKALIMYLAVRLCGWLAWH